VGPGIAVPLSWPAGGCTCPSPSPPFIDMWHCTATAAAWLPPVVSGVEYPAVPLYLSGQPKSLFFWLAIYFEYGTLLVMAILVRSPCTTSTTTATAFMRLLALLYLGLSYNLLSKCKVFLSIIEVRATYAAYGAVHWASFPYGTACWCFCCVSTCTVRAGLSIVQYLYYTCNTCKV
jgi:hypothetical protein